MAKRTTKQTFTAAMLRAGAAAIEGMNALSPIEMARAVLHAAFTPQRPAKKKAAKKKSPAKRKSPARRKATRAVRKAARKVAKTTRKATRKKAAKRRT